MRDLQAHQTPPAMFALRRAVGRLLAVTATAGVVSSCGHTEPTYTPSQASSAMTLAAIPPSPVSGTLAGRRFTTHDTWYRVIRKAGRERIDIFLTEGRQTRLCAESDPESARHVWVRFPGWQIFRAGEYRIDPGTAHAPMSVHFEVPDEEHHWEGNGTASAVVSIDAVSGDSVTGRMRACWGDAHHSCVEGSFRAIECRPETEPDSPTAGNYRRREPPPPRDASAPHPATPPLEAAPHDGGAAP